MTVSPDLAYRPGQVDQLDGSRYAGLNCNCAAAAMAIERSTLGAKRTTGARVRLLTGDTVAGTNLDQIDKVATEHYNVNLDVERALAFDEFMERIRSGKGAVLQGACIATRGTEYQESENFAGNHSWYVNDHNGDGFLVYLPLGDARRKGITDSPRRIPKAVVQDFAGELSLGDRKLGNGKVYAAFTRDTERHDHFHGGARRTSPFPDRVRADETVKVRNAPGSTTTVVKTLHDGDLFVAYQQTDNYLGNHYGNEWVPKRAMRRIGGST